MPDDWELTQCLFGEHLLSQYPEATVALVESEKTAVICASLMPKFIWVATGGKTQLGDKLDVLRGRKVLAFPDIDAYDTWQEKLAAIPHLNIKVSDYLMKNATPEDHENHIDIADLLLRENSAAQATQKPMSILEYFSEEYHGEISQLIEELDLIPVSISELY